MADQNIDLEQAALLDDEAQKEVDKLRNDPWQPLPAKDGFVPTDLVPEAPEGSSAYDQGCRESWSQSEVCEIVSAGARPITNRDNSEVVEGYVAFIDFECKQGPNEGKTVGKQWWVRFEEPAAKARFNDQILKIFESLKIEQVLKENGQGNMVPSPLGTMEKLEGRMVTIRLSQKWDYKFRPDGRGGFNKLDDEPKVFKKRIYEVKAA